MEWHTRKLNATHLHYMGLKKTGQGLFLGGASRQVPQERGVGSAHQRAERSMVHPQKGGDCVLEGRSD
jgi:hypothetical protein